MRHGAEGCGTGRNEGSGCEGRSEVGRNSQAEAKSRLTINGREKMYACAESECYDSALIHAQIN